MTLNDVKNLFTSNLTEIKLKEINTTFIPVNSNVTKIDNLTFWKYVNNIPQRFFNRNIFNIAFPFFLNNFKHYKDQLEKSPYNVSENMDIALLCLNEINSLKFHNDELKEPYEKLFIIENMIHPNYLKLAEGVYSNLIIPFAAIKLINEKKNAGSFRLNVRYEKIERVPEYQEIVLSYNRVLRNAIAHRRYKVLDYEIIYFRENGNFIKLSFSEVFHLFDSLLDTCNGLALSYESFYYFCLNKLSLQVPKQFFIDEFKELNDIKDWEILSILDSEPIDKEKQLNIYITNKLNNTITIRLLLIRMAVLISSYFPDYKKYCFILKSKYYHFYQEIYNTPDLVKCVKGNRFSYEDLIKCKQVPLFDLRPNKILFHPLKFIFRIINDFKKLYRFYSKETEIRIRKGYYKLRKSNYHIHAGHFIIRADIVIICYQPDQIIEYIYNNYRYLVNSVCNNLKKGVCLFSINHFLPKGFVKLHVWVSDFRRRSFYGLKRDLLCVIKYNKLQLRDISILNSKVEKNGNYQIEWNINPME